MHFMLDENVPASVADMLEARGHRVGWIRDFVPPGSPDPLVATISEDLQAILVSFDGDFRRIAPRVHRGQRARFRKLCRVWMKCSEPQATKRLEYALPFIAAEYQLALPGRIIIQIGASYLRTDR
jgi:predicted nuclease of predicted toxin-antitoxin system